MNPYLEIIRPLNALMAVVAILLMIIITGNFNYIALGAMIVVFLVTGAGNAINDYFDYAIDAINRPDRPIPSGRILRKTAGIYSMFLFVGGVIIAFILNFVLGVIAFLSSLLMIYYAHSLKRKCLIGNISISFLTGLCFVFGGIAVQSIFLSIMLGLYAFMMTMAREIVKDMEDVQGDKEVGARTLPLTYGLGISSKLAIFFILVSSLTSPLLYFIGLFTIAYIPILLVAIVLFLYGAYSLHRNQTPETSKTVSRIIKTGMAIVFLAFALGSPFLWSL